jgi:hypothetical protein
MVTKMKNEHYTLWIGSSLVTKTDSHTRNDYDDMLERAYEETCKYGDSHIRIYSSRDDLVWDSQEADIGFENECHMTDVEADADTLASAGYGTDEDYGYYGDDCYDY